MTFSLYLARRVPQRMGDAIVDRAKRELPPGYDSEKHFRPRYKIWDNRLCLILDGDLFQSIGRGDLTMVTGEIERFTGEGLLLTSGEHIPADIVVAATGFHMRLFGGIEFYRDDEPIDFSSTVCYKGMMLDGIPQLRIHRRIPGGHLHPQGRHRVAIRQQAAGLSLREWDLLCDTTSR